MLMASNASDVASPNKGRTMTYYCYIFPSTLNAEERSRKLEKFRVRISVSSRTVHAYTTYEAAGQHVPVGQCYFKADSDKLSYRESLNRGQLAGHEINELFSEVELFLH